MKKVKMSIHRGLAELKLMDAKITRKIKHLDVVGTKQKDKMVNNYKSEDDFKTDAGSKLQSIKDLIQRKLTIKEMIVQSNSETDVVIGDQKMSVADAITLKDNIKLKKDLLERLRSQLQECKAKKEQGITQLEANLQKILEAMFSDLDKVDDKAIESVRKPYVEANEVHIVDPLKIEDEIESLEKEIETFETEVDASLSEINAVTFIEV